MYMLDHVHIIDLDANFNTRRPISFSSGRQFSDGFIGLFQAAMRITLMSRNVLSSWEMFRLFSACWARSTLTTDQPVCEGRGFMLQVIDALSEEAAFRSEAPNDFLDDRFSDKFLCFGPRIDKAFFDGKSIEQLIEEAPPKPNLMGLMVNESGPFLLFNLPPSKIQTYSRDDIIKYINESIPEAGAGKETEPIRRELINRYVDNLPVSSANVSKFWHDQHVRLLSEYMFVASVMAEVHQKYDQKWPVYLYTWNHVSAEFKAQTGVSGAFHAYDLWFISDEHPFPDTHGPMELAVQDVYAEMVSQFAKTGNPSSNGLKFPRFSKWKQRVFWIDPKPSIRKNIFIKANTFYDYLEEEYDYSVRRGIKKSLENEL
uniref:COesterase domain-containing protein n=1 Tax=Panagrellus redivivus TaxID=6233 RepID=A0A7E4ZXF4_PANRE